MKKQMTVMLAAVFLGMLGGAAGRADESQFDQAFEGLGLEELMQIEVTSVSKKQQPLREAAAAVHVLTREDIRRSGATSIPEALRLVPGVQVARIDSNKWAITARGFNGRFANKLLVLIDGRSVYTPLFSGVFWDVQDTPLVDIDRIEVIRGPGGTLWGANAYGGIINIITRHSARSQGTVMRGRAGTEERPSGLIRYGGAHGEDTFYRVFLKYDERDALKSPPGLPESGSWEALRGGFRIDRQASISDSWTLQGDWYGEEARDRVTVPRLTAPFAAVLEGGTDVSGGYLQARWKRETSPDDEVSLNVYLDKTRRRSDVLRFRIDALDLDFQKRSRRGRHEVVWGFGYRRISDDNEPGFLAVALHPRARTTHLVSAFVQDEIRLRDPSLRLTVGSKFEDNDYSGFEVQPSVRLLWERDERRTAWFAISRAVRTPSRVESDGRINSMVIPGGAGGPILLALAGNPDLEAEDLLAYELGYRSRLRRDLTLDAALFYNEHDDLVTLEPVTPTAEAFPLLPHVFAPFRAQNLLEGHTQGAELALDWQARDNWKLRLGYSYLGMDLRPKAGSRDVLALRDEGTAPRHSAYLRSLLDLSSTVQGDATLRFVDALSRPGVPAYLELDLRLGWQPQEDLTIDLVGQNLLDSSHFEFTPSIIGSQLSEVRRGAYIRVTHRF